MKPLILITNDDGIFSPGLRAAAEALRELGDLLIVAPRDQQTSMSRAFPKTDDVGIIEEVQLIVGGRQHLAYSVAGSPALAVSHAVLELAPRKPDLCVSGINYGENLGLSVFPSGTVGAALEANSYDIPSLAVSTEASIRMQHSSEYDELDWQAAAHFTEHCAAKVLKEGLPSEIAFLNINVPGDATSSTEIRVTCQSRQNYFVFEKPQRREFSKSYRFKVLVEIDKEALDPQSDIKAFVFDRVVSITPMTWDLTVRCGWKL